MVSRTYSCDTVARVARRARKPGYNVRVFLLLRDLVDDVRTAGVHHVYQMIPSSMRDLTVLYSFDFFPRTFSILFRSSLAEYLTAF